MQDPFESEKEDELLPMPEDAAALENSMPPLLSEEATTAEDPDPTKEKKKRASVTKLLSGIRLGRIIRYGLVACLGIWLYLNWHPDLPMQTLMQQYSFADSQFLNIDGAQVHCRITGKGQPILLLHDGNSSLHTWDAWSKHFDLKKYQLISVDLPGFGLTGPHPRSSYSVFSYASFVDSLSNCLNIKRFSIAGNGLGALVAWYYVLENPSKVDRLVLLSAPGFEAKKSDWITLIARIPVLNRVMWSITPKSFFRLMLEDIYADNALVTPELVQRHFDLALRPGNRKAFTDRANVSDNRPPGEEVANINTPTLILWGAEDTRISPEYIYLFHKKIRKSVIRIYQNTGHWPQEENPERTAQDVQAFLEGRF